jgi:hypothetical protein
LAVIGLAPNVSRRKRHVATAINRCAWFGALLTSQPGFSRKEQMMKKSVSVVLAILLAGSTSLAVAQTSAAAVANVSSGTDWTAVKKRFADQIATFQSLSDSRSPAWSLSKPTFSNTPTDPTAGLNERQMQALSSESPMWQSDLGKVEVDHGPSFAQTHPHGLTEADYQALSSETAMYQNLDSVGGTSALASANHAPDAGGAATTSIATRIANFFHVARSTTPTTVN